MTWWARYSAVRMGLFTVATVINLGTAFHVVSEGRGAFALFEIAFSWFTASYAFIEWEKPRE